MKLFEDSFSILTNLVNAKVPVLFISMFSTQISWHFINAPPKGKCWRKVRVKTFRLGSLSHKIYELAHQNEDMYLFSPYSVEH